MFRKRGKGWFRVKSSTSCKLLCRRNCRCYTNLKSNYWSWKMTHQEGLKPLFSLNYHWVFIWPFNFTYYRIRLKDAMVKQILLARLCVTDLNLGTFSKNLTFYSLGNIEHLKFITFSQDHWSTPSKIKDWIELQICQLLLSEQLMETSQLLSYTNSTTICLRENVGRCRLLFTAESHSHISVSYFSHSDGCLI